MTGIKPVTFRLLVSFSSPQASSSVSFPADLRIKTLLHAAACLPASSVQPPTQQEHECVCVCVRSSESLCVFLDKSLQLLSVFIRGPVNLQIIAAVLYFNTHTHKHPMMHTFVEPWRILKTFKWLQSVAGLL